MRKCKRFHGWVLPGLALVALASSSMAASPVYKCVDESHQWLYTDVPCKDGEMLDLHAGEADPAAMAKLNRDAFDLTAARRIADQQRLQQSPVRYAVAEDQAVYEPQYDYGPGWWVPGYVPSRASHPRSRKLLHSGHVPAKPSTPRPLP
jgi:Domain of unknown function (DUF4124)